MPSKNDVGPAILLEDVRKSFTAGGRTVVAVDGIGARVARGSITGLIGPDGAGKTTLMRLAAGLLAIDRGRVEVLGIDVAEEPLKVQARIGYMPQHFGLYEDLTVAENLSLYADLQGVAAADRQARFSELLHMTGLASFTGRLAGRLSGGMKQKLGLACTLVRPPSLLLLDEPTVGVDPVSRRELWTIVDALVRSEKMTVLLSTAYLDEAERCDTVLLMHEGHLIGEGAPSEFTSKMAGRCFRIAASGIGKRRLQERLAETPGVLDVVIQGAHVRVVMDGSAPPQAAALGPSFEHAAIIAAPPRFEDSFVALLKAPGASPAVRPAFLPQRSTAALAGPSENIIAVEHVTRTFGSFYAVNDVSFTVRKGEIFGLLGANGAGKSTVFRMLCGLLPPSAGALRVAGFDVREAAATARGRIGYMAQKFSLYGDLSVHENLRFFSSAYGLRGARQAARIAWALEEFELGSFSSATSKDLPLGYKQRLALACALMHEPSILFLDEPTSGVDPLARRDFWRRINSLAESGVTILVTTHFMEEAEYCDRLVIMANGAILAEGTSESIKARFKDAAHPEPSMEDAFVALIEGDHEGGGMSEAIAPPPVSKSAGKEARFGSLVRLRGLLRKEFLQIGRDPSSIAIAFLLPAVLLLIFGYGVSLDAKNVPVALVTEQPSADTASFTARFAQSPYFRPEQFDTVQDAERAMTARKVKAIVWLRSDFARRLQAANATIGVIVNGVDANDARLIEGYLQQIWADWIVARAQARGMPSPVPVAAEPRVWFNPAVSSRDYLVPGLIAIIMTLTGALLTAMVIAREWERGTMEALMVTRVSVRELLVAKLIPYFVLGMGGMAASVAMAVWVFDVPLRGSTAVLAIASALFLLAALGMGLLISSAARTQFVAGQIAIIATFLPAFILSGFLFDINSMPEPIQVITHLIAARYFVAILQTVFLAGDIWSVILANVAALAVMAAGFLGAARLMAHKRLD
jgi:ABC-2 type transport system permease protein